MLLIHLPFRCVMNNVFSSPCVIQCLFIRCISVHQALSLQTKGETQHSCNTSLQRFLWQNTYCSTQHVFNKEHMSPQHSGHRNNSHHIIGYGSSINFQVMVCNIVLNGLWSSAISHWLKCVKNINSIFINICVTSSQRKRDTILVKSLEPSLVVCKYTWTHIHNTVHR